MTKVLSEKRKKALVVLHAKPRTKEWREKMSIAQKRIGNKPPIPQVGVPSGMLGKHHTEETKKRIAEFNKGRKHTEKTKKKLSEMFKGEKSYLWRGGISKNPYPEVWTETLKRAIRERDNYVCRLCGRTQIEELEIVGRKLAVHYINYDKKNCNPDNLITLCCVCNVKVNQNRNYWISYFLGL